MLLNVFLVWVLPAVSLCSVDGGCGVVILVLSIIQVVGDGLLWVICMLSVGV